MAKSTTIYEVIWINEAGGRIGSPSPNRHSNWPFRTLADAKECIRIEKQPTPQMSKENAEYWAAQKYAVLKVQTRVVYSEAVAK